MADYKGNTEKIVSSSYLYEEENKLITLLRSKFSENKELLDKLGVNSDGHLTYDGVEVASSNVSIDPDSNNIISLTENGLLAKHQSLENYELKTDAESNYLKKDDANDKYIPYSSYTDNNKKILGTQIKKKSIKYSDIDDIGELDGVNIEAKLLEHLKNKRIHNVSTLNSININVAEWTKGTLTNFVVNSNGRLGLKQSDEVVNPDTGETVPTYTLNQAEFVSRIYDLSDITPLVTISIDSYYNPYLSNISIFVRSGTTPTYSEDTYTDWQNVTDSLSLAGIETRYVQIRLLAQTADRYKDINFEYIQVFFGMDNENEISDARNSLDGTHYNTLKSRLDAIEEVTNNALPKNLGVDNAGKTVKVDNLGNVVAVNSLVIDDEISSDSTNPVQNKVIKNFVESEVSSVVDEKINTGLTSYVQTSTFNNHTSNNSVHLSSSDRNSLTDLVSKKHEHNNKDVLDKLGISDTGFLMFNGQKVDGEKDGDSSEEINGMSFSYKVFLNHEKDKQIEAFSTSSKMKNYFFQAYKFIEGDTVSSTIKRFNNTEEENFNSGENVSFDSLGMHIKDEYELKMSEYENGLYVSEVFNKNDFVDIVGGEI